MRSTCAAELLTALLNYLTLPPHTQQLKLYNIQTTHPHLASKLRMSGDVCPPPIYLYGMLGDNFTFTYFKQ